MGRFNALERQCLTMLTKQAISEFREIYFNKYGETLSDMEATEKANDLLSLYKTVYRVAFPRECEHDE